LCKPTRPLSPISHAHFLTCLVMCPLVLWVQVCKKL
jgi:hypothetical protein